MLINLRVYENENKLPSLCYSFITIKFFPHQRSQAFFTNIGSTAYVIVSKEAFRI